ncbi:hypothetical protein FNU76_07285 [Chitinimonas arctica]|uniref:Uncharacterized protein n=1 Tax=Chitinimonas arctica TaxID=2594795 RepID=A0A516SDE7_9NEIS|nr:hypothetical protein [Chitinimonas arctica]QDQ26176.1 hypothetical protein FNU76_07285 [Chitinimonas arctica]
MTKPEKFDPLAGLIEHEMGPAQKADRWAGRLLKLTLLFLFADIALFIVFMLTAADLIPDRLVANVLPHWDYLAGGTLLAVIATFICGVLKMSYEMTES